MELGLNITVYYSNYKTFIQHSKTICIIMCIQFIFKRFSILYGQVDVVQNYALDEIFSHILHIEIVALFHIRILNDAPNSLYICNTVDTFYMHKDLKEKYLLNYQGIQAEYNWRNKKHSIQYKILCIEK